MGFNSCKNDRTVHKSKIFTLWHFTRKLVFYSTFTRDVFSFVPSTGTHGLLRQPALPWLHLIDRSFPFCRTETWLLRILVHWVYALRKQEMVLFIKLLPLVLDSSPLNNMTIILPKYLKFSVFLLKCSFTLWQK